MTDLNAAIVSAGPSAAAREVAPIQEESTAGLTADFNTFLTLLTTQLRSQDPLNPIESTEFVSQLANFSSVEQQVQTNKFLGQMLEAMTTGGPDALAQWLGREVRAPAPVAFSGAPVTVFPQEAPALATSATLVARNANGDIVSETPMDLAATSVDWAGLDAAGAALPAGLYKLSVRYGLPEGETQTGEVETFANVVEARRENDKVMLRLASGAVIDAESVTGVRTASPAPVAAQPAPAAPAPQTDAETDSEPVDDPVTDPAG
jgi:flagellar basal-body rod modification protein FlgD